MGAISRRMVLGWAAIGLGGIVTGVASCGTGQPTPSGSPLVTAPTGNAPSGNPPTAQLAEPPVLRSENGLLEVAMTAVAGATKLAGRTVRAAGYDGRVPGPTLRVRPGDRMVITLRNALAETTNLHTHGLLVSPQGNGDNPFVEIEPGESFTYEIALPDDHPPGVFWYHPHHHGMVADQVFAGLFGAIVVEDADEIPVTRERVLVISDVTITGGGGGGGAGAVASAGPADRMMGREGETVLVNGQVRPVLNARPGERERWRVVNACVSRFLDLRLSGQDLTLLGLDSGRVPSPSRVDAVVLAPGNRADLLVETRAGTSLLEAEPVDRGAPMGMMRGARPVASVVTLAELVVDGAVAGALDRVPTAPAPLDLSATPVARTREITLGIGMGPRMGVGMMSFTIDGKEFDPDRTDLAVPLGDVEEWTLVNSSPMDHPFHLHVWPMQVIRIGSQQQSEPTWRDVVNVPAGQGTVVRVAFDRHPGRTVYHCHILDHEDLGMMGVIEVA